MTETSHERRLRESAARTEIPRALKSRGIVVSQLEVDDAITSYAFDQGLDEEQMKRVNRAFLGLVIDRPNELKRYFAMPEQPEYFDEQKAIHDVRTMLLERVDKSGKPAPIERTPDQIKRGVRELHRRRKHSLPTLKKAYEEVEHVLIEYQDDPLPQIFPAYSQR